jgi:hypothetical protein
VLVGHVAHLLGGFGIGTADLVFLAVFEHVLEGHRTGLDIADLADVSLDLDVVVGLFEDLLGDAAGGDPVDCFASGGAAAAAPVPGPELRGVCVVPVGRPRSRDEGLVLARAGVLVLDDHPDGRARRVAVLNPGVNRHLIRFAPGGGDHRLAGLAPVEVFLYLFL